VLSRIEAAYEEPSQRDPDVGIGKNDPGNTLNELFVAADTAQRKAAISYVAARIAQHPDRWVDRLIEAAGAEQRANAESILERLPELLYYTYNDSGSQHALKWLLAQPTDGAVGEAQAHYATELLIGHPAEVTAMLQTLGDRVEAGLKPKTAFSTKVKFLLDGEQKKSLAAARDRICRESGTGFGCRYLTAITK
jgi:hypothetical protein